MTDKSSNLIGKIDISPKEDFDNGISLNFSVVAGTQGLELISTLPSYFQSNPITYSMQFLLTDAEEGTKIVGTLESLRDMILGMVPGAQEAVQQGININFRHVGNTVNIDVGLEGMFAEMVKAKLAEVNLDLKGFSESGEFSIISGLTLNNALDIGLEEILNKVSQFKVQGNGQMPTKLFFDSILNGITNGLGGMLTGKMKLGLKMVKALTVLRKIQFSTKYDSNVFCEYVRELAGRMAHNILAEGKMDELNHEIGVQVLGSVVASGQETGKMQLEGLKQGMMMFIEPYIDTIKSLNLDDVSLNVFVAEYGLQVKFRLCLVGISEFLKTYILN